MHLLGVNFAAVLVAAVIQWVLGWLWFGMLFKKSWLELVGQKEGGSSAGVMALTFIANLILCFALAKIVGIEALAGAQWTTFARGSLIGAVTGLGFVAPPMFAQHICEKQPFKLFGINVLYWLIGMYFAGGVLAVWH
jgi:Protein of unknown function (DUF1761)